MLKNKEFRKYALPILILGVLYMFFYSGLQNDHLNIITPYFTKLGWSNTKVTYPVTIAGFVVIVFYFLIGTLMVKHGPVKIMVISTFILGLSTIGLSFSEHFANYGYYFICLFLVRLLCTSLQMGVFMLCTNWFIRYRGRVLGLVTIGSPLFSVCGIMLLTTLVNNLGFQYGYIILGTVVVVVAILTALLVKSRPEDVGLYPDGSTIPSSDTEESEDISLKELLTQLPAWQLIISYGILQFVIVGMMAFMAMRYITLGGEELWMSALPWLSLGALLGIPISYVLGWVDDKVGSIKASLLLCALYLFAVIPLAIMPASGSKLLMASWAFGVACMTGGCPTMHPCITAYVYGRKKYQAANKCIMSIQAIIMAIATPYMSYFFDIGNADIAYYIMIGLLAIAFVTLMTMSKIKDANIADRDYATK